MNITLDRDVALGAVARAAAICARTNTILILGHVVIEPGDSTVRFRACNLESEVMATISASVGERGDTSVPAQNFVDILKNARPGDVSIIVVDHGDPRASVKSGRSNFKLPTLPPDMLPTFDLGEAEHEITLDGTAAHFLLSTCIHAASRDGNLINIANVCLMATGDKLKTYATNIKRMAAAEIDVPKAGEWVRMLPVRTAQQFADLAEGADEITLRIGRTLVECVAGDVRIVSKIMDATAAPYERVLGGHGDTIATVTRADLLQAIKRALIVNSDDYRSLCLDFAKGSLSVSTKAPQSGEAADEIEADYDGPDVHVATNGGFLLDAINRIEGEIVRIALKDNKTPLLITDPGEPRARFLVGVQHG